MPVDHPDAKPGAVRRAPTPRLLIVALSFLVTFGAFLLLSPLFNLGVRLQ
jgi:hypothetical protein